MSEPLEAQDKLKLRPPKTVYEVTSNKKRPTGFL
jgi:hypothetical protein